MLNFSIDEQKCISCRSCVNDCPAMIIEMREEIPFIMESNEQKCFKCQHCLAVCPTGALSIFGIDPKTCVPIEKACNTEQLDALIRNRRTVRKFKKGNASKEKLDKMIKAAANAPTGKNGRQVTLTVIDDEAIMAKFKEILILKIEKASEEGKLTDRYEIFTKLAKHYRNGSDLIFRGAPQMIMSSCPKDSATPDADGIIALTYAELMGSTLGLGVVWAGFVMHILELFPETLQELGIPEDHRPGYVLLVGESNVKYYRGVKRDDITLNKPVL